MGNSIAAFLMLAGALAATEGGTPRQVVQTAIARVSHLLESESGRSEPQVARRRTEMRRIAADLFDFDEMARRALARHWAERTPGEQEEFVRIFTDLLERSYIPRIETYGGEQILYLGDALDRQFATVRSRVVSPRGGDTSLDYRLRLAERRWRVYDVVVDGVSLVSTYHGEFARIIERSSYDALLERMRERSDPLVPPRSARGH
jgi:phospholipid transport system substrate-binding protein